MTPDIPTPHQGYFGVAGAAAFLSTTPKGIYALVSRHQIPHRRLGRRLLFDPVELRAWVDRHSIPAMAP